MAIWFLVGECERTFCENSQIQKKLWEDNFFSSWNTLGQSSRKQRNYDGDDQGKCNLLK
jgi:hypothetical protein